MIDDAINNAHSVRPTKGERTREKIIRAAVKSLARLGFERTTFQSIADECGISQPLVVHYFKKKENVFPFVIDYLTSRTQSVIDGELDHEKPPEQRLRDFVRISLSYVRKEADEARIFLTLSYLAAFDEHFRHSNAQIKEVAVHELIDIVLAGVQKGVFQVEEVALTAKLLASYIMGVRMNMLNEKARIADAVLIRAVEEHCLLLVRYTEAVV